MSKRLLKKYLHSLEKEHLEEQVLDLYQRFKEVKTYYNFVFNPKEEQLIGQSKAAISKEYFPISRRKPKARRSVAQKIIKHFIQLGVDSALVADIMLYNMELAQMFSAQKVVKQEAFYKSILKSYEQAVVFISSEGHMPEFKERLNAIKEETIHQDWINSSHFEAIFENSVL